MNQCASKSLSLIHICSFLRSDEGFDLNWQLLDVGTKSVRSGGAIRVASLDLIAVQTEISNEVFASLHGLPAGEQMDAPRPAPRDVSLPGPVSEDYLQARAVLSSFMVRTGSRLDLDRAHALFTRVTEKDPEYASGWCGLGIAELQYVRHGFGGQIHVMLSLIHISTTIVSAGVSTGGFAQVALSADPPPGVKAAISFAGGRGGDGHEHNCDLGAVIGAFGSFGKSAHKHGDLPMLWIYSQNDHWFTPAMADKFEEAYTKSGATNQFVMAPPDGDDGHHLYAHVAAWSDTVAAFLKAHALLPLGDKLLPEPRAPDIPMPAVLQAKDEEMWKLSLIHI